MNKVISREYVENNYIPIDFINERIELHRESIKRTKPDNLIMIEYYEDKIEELESLKASWRGKQ